MKYEANIILGFDMKYHDKNRGQSFKIIRRILSQDCLRIWHEIYDKDSGQSCKVIHEILRRDYLGICMKYMTKSRGNLARLYVKY